MPGMEFHCVGGHDVMPEHYERGAGQRPGGVTTGLGGRGSAATHSSCSPFRNTHDTDDWVGQHDERERERERVNNGERSDPLFCALPP